MKLKALFKDLPVEFRGSKETQVNGLSSDSKRVSPGHLFIAKKGKTHDGAKFIPEAVQNGAEAVLTDVYDPFLKVTQVIHPDPTAIEALIAARFYQEPSQKIFLAGVTGTNGKTTTTYLIKHILDKENCACGLMGTIECIIGENHYYSQRTTSDVITNQKFLHEMVKAGCQAAIMEVTSHALEQNRVQQLHFNAAMFTNLTPEHLDYHHTMEEYAAAKRKFFQLLDKNAFAIVNADSPYAKTMLEGCLAKPFTFGIDTKADLMAKDIVLTPSGMEFTVCFQGQEKRFDSRLIGRFNVHNILTATALSLVKGVPLAKIKEAVASFRTVSGRLEKVSFSSKIHVFVDYAHTPDALFNVLSTLKEIKKGKMITVFGCGGNRDRTKRPVMGKVSEELSDFTIVTSDNPRTEEPQAIIQEIIGGFKEKRFETELDREKAIAKAIQMAGKEDIVLIAGKGHEKSQIFAHKTIPFDDVEIAKQVLQAL